MPNLDPKKPKADSVSAAQYSTQPEVRANNFPPPPTPTANYTVTPASARPSTFPQEYLARQQHYTPSSAASMAQATSPSLPLSDGQNPNSSSNKSNSDVPIDPSIAHSSPTYPGTPYSPYAQGHNIEQYPGHPPPNYHWPGYGHPHGLPYSGPGTNSTSGSPATTGPPRAGQVGLNQGPKYLCKLTLDSGLFVRSDSRRAATQASASQVRGDRANVQVWPRRM